MNEAYVYEWYNVDTNEVFYVGKGRNNRMHSMKNRNQYFKEKQKQKNSEEKQSALYQFLIHFVISFPWSLLSLQFF